MSQGCRTDIERHRLPAVPPARPERDPDAVFAAARSAHLQMTASARLLRVPWSLAKPDEANSQRASLIVQQLPDEQRVLLLDSDDRCVVLISWAPAQGTAGDYRPALRQVEDATLQLPNACLTEIQSTRGRGFATVNVNLRPWPIHTTTNSESWPTALLNSPQHTTPLIYGDALARLAAVARDNLGMLSPAHLLVYDEVAQHPELRAVRFPVKPEELRTLDSDAAARVMARVGERGACVFDPHGGIIANVISDATICAQHKDMRDHMYGLASVMVHGEHFVGGALHLRELGIKVDTSDGTVVTFPARQITHGNSALLAGRRGSLVFFTSAGLIDKFSATGLSIDTFVRCTLT
ncbi:hypothetical protein FA09DRAFT_359880 [Tilletiopsis washingtonensis]|uniref:Uncharacterized protein n=1 Tax=Tilletiopsis washingtonensis TaxID=58919 RepID=A0A316ZCD3_9BASI|nr:hypothetical protein FA09DRAFT_359880 [Tilletiopsis washingtonensis]PWN98698.1 hypothetical protein FA09DRAFT_359880 [Tilletiopsis washingtonensis]